MPDMSDACDITHASTWRQSDGCFIVVGNSNPGGRRAGNFHGEYPAKASDYLAIAAGEMGIMSERRLERMVNAHLSSGLPPYLIKSKNAGLESGFMIVQYTAAAIVSENKVGAEVPSSFAICLSPSPPPSARALRGGERPSALSSSHQNQTRDSCFCSQRPPLLVWCL